jgi:hypothetical protein
MEQPLGSELGILKRQRLQTQNVESPVLFYLRKTICNLHERDIAHQWHKNKSHRHSHATNIQLYLCSRTASSNLSRSSGRVPHVQPRPHCGRSARCAQLHRGLIHGRFPFAPASPSWLACFRRCACRMPCWSFLQGSKESSSAMPCIHPPFSQLYTVCVVSAHWRILFKHRAKVPCMSRGSVLYRGCSAAQGVHRLRWRDRRPARVHRRRGQGLRALRRWLLLRTAKQDLRPMLLLPVRKLRARLRRLQQHAAAAVRPAARHALERQRL